MLVRRYLVSAMPEALQLIRKELGKDAVILSSKKIRRGGWLGLFMKEKIEVIAAMTSQAEAPRQAPTFASVDHRSTPAVDRSNLLAGWDSVSSAGHAMNRPPAQRSEHQGGSVLTEVKPVANDRQKRMSASTGVHDTLDDGPLGSVPREYLHQKPDVEPRGEDLPVVDTVGLLNEVREMKQMLRHLSFRASSIAEELIPLQNRLVEQMVDERHRESIMASAESIRRTGLSPGEAFRTKLLEQMTETLADQCQASGLAAETRIAAFIGPTGVGKTTTIAKLAADLILKQGKRPALITTDTYRIAAVDQLRTYATILGIPLEVVFSTNDIETVLERLGDRDIILVDTAGRNYRDRSMVDSLTRILESLAPDETLLSLSMTTKETDLRQVVNNFLPLGVDKFVFTKLDETDVMGPAYHLLADYRLPVAYFTTGQNVPDDFELASIQRLCAMIVGETWYGGSS